MKISISVLTAVAGSFLLLACGPPRTDSFSGTATGQLEFGSGGSSYGLTVTDGTPSHSGAVLSGTDAGAIVSTGSATYTGLYRMSFYLAGATEIGSTNGPISLVADFDAATLTGSAGDLAIAGDISGGTLSGDVTWLGIAGTLGGGIIGADRTTGYFCGAADGAGFSGVFLASP